MKVNKYKISGEITIKTGLHIGASDAFSAIGATDSPVIKDPYTKRPVIPGSSLKGKMRKLLASEINTKIVDDPNKDHYKIARLFGSSDFEGDGCEKKGTIQGRLIFTDSIMTKEESERLENLGVDLPTEVKFENTINRKTAEATPRQIERVIAGSQFNFELIYTSEQDNEIEEDLKNIKLGLDLLKYDYLGGSGTRGYGRIDYELSSLENPLDRNDPKVEEYKGYLGIK